MRKQTDDPVKLQRALDAMTEARDFWQESARVNRETKEKIRSERNEIIKAVAELTKQRDHLMDRLREVSTGNEDVACLEAQLAEAQAQKADVARVKEDTIDSLYRTIHTQEEAIEEWRRDRNDETERAELAEARLARLEARDG